MAAWEEMIEGELLSGGLVSGAALLSLQGECVYTSGSISHDTPPETWLQFRGLFERTNEKHKKMICNSVFELPVENQRVRFRVVNATRCSVYGTSSGGSEGLIVCKVDHALLVCLHNQPRLTGRIISHIEHFADLLRL